MPRTATVERVDRVAPLGFLRPRHRANLTTCRSAGELQLSPVTCGVDGEGRIVVSTYPQPAKVRNARCDPSHRGGWSTRTEACFRLRKV